MTRIEILKDLHYYQRLCTVAEYTNEGQQCRSFSLIREVDAKKNSFSFSAKVMLNAGVMPFGRWKQVYFETLDSPFDLHYYRTHLPKRQRVVSSKFTLFSTIEDLSVKILADKKGHERLKDNDAEVLKRYIHMRVKHIGVFLTKSDFAKLCSLLVAGVKHV